MNRSKPLRSKKAWPNPAKRRQPLQARSEAKIEARPEEILVWEAVQKRDRTCRVAAMISRHLAGPCFGDDTPHHRRKAGAGGAYSLENIRLVCLGHNGALEDDPELAAAAEAIGLVIREGDSSWERLGRRAYRESFPQIDEPIR